MGRSSDHASLRSREHPLAPRWVFSELLSGNFIPQSSTVVRRNLLRKVGGYRDGARFAEDYDVLLRMSILSMFVEVPCATAYRRTHAGQASRHTARLYSEALLARTRGIEFAESMGMQVDQGLKDDSLQHFLDDALETARFRADGRLRDAVLRSVAPTSCHWQSVTHWRRRHLPFWPYYRLKALARQLFRPRRQASVREGAGSSVRS